MAALQLMELGEIRVFLVHLLEDCISLREAISESNVGSLRLPLESNHIGSPQNMWRLRAITQLSFRKIERLRPFAHFRAKPGN